MKYRISNEKINVEIDSLGAELSSIKEIGNCHEFLWQGDKEHWDGRAYNMFPVCGRLIDSRFKVDGKEYEMEFHGFARNSEFNAEKKCENEIEFILTDDEESFKKYPFHFVYTVKYSLSNNTLSVIYSVKNTDLKTLPFTLGFHPGFNIPLQDDGSVFEDYKITFNEKSDPDRILFSDGGYYINKKERYPLENGDTIKLNHALFDNDAIFLENAPKSLTVSSDKNDKKIRIDYPDMKYVGFWHTNKSRTAPFVCVEPWNGMPSELGADTDIYTKRDMIHLLPGEEYKNEIRITIE